MSTIVANNKLKVLYQISLILKTRRDSYLFRLAAGAIEDPLEVLNLITEFEGEGKEYVIESWTTYGSRAGHGNRRGVKKIISRKELENLVNT